MTGPKVRNTKALVLQGEAYVRANRAVVALLGQNLSDQDIPAFVLDELVAFNMNLLDVNGPPFRTNGQAWSGSMPYNTSAFGVGALLSAMVANEPVQNRITAACVESVTLEGPQEAPNRLGLVGFRTPSWIKKTSRIYYTEPFAEVVTPAAAGLFSSAPIAREVSGLFFATQDHAAPPAIDGTDYSELTGDLLSPVRVEFTDGECVLWPGMGLCVFAQAGTAFTQPCRVTVSGRLWNFGTKKPSP